MGCGAGAAPASGWTRRHCPMSRQLRQRRLQLVAQVRVIV